MLKEVQMSIKMESELRRRLMAAAANVHRPAAQIVRDLIRSFIAQQEIPNAQTLEAIESAERGEVNTYVTADDFLDEVPALFAQLNPHFDGKRPEFVESERDW